MCPASSTRIDHACSHLATKRDAGAHRLSLDPIVLRTQNAEIDLVAPNEVLTELAALDPRQGHLVELRLLAGLSIEEIAVVLGISRAVVKRKQATGQAWLRWVMR